MNYNELLTNYINKCPVDEPIFIEDIKEYFKLIITNNDFTKVINNIYVYINRLVKNNTIVLFAKGIYYKPAKGTFGNKKLNINKVIEKKYLKDNTNIKGYITGAYLYNQLGLTTQISNNITIITNECPNGNEYENKLLNVKIRKPKIEINNANYLYLQLLDLIVNKDNIKIEVDNEKEIIYNFIKHNNLNWELIFKYAKLTNNKKAIEKLYNYE